MKIIATAFVKRLTLRRPRSSASIALKSFGDHGMQQSRRALIVGLLCISNPAFAHGDKKDARSSPAKKEQKAWGIAGDAKAVRRTIPVGMTDDMRFSPGKIEVKRGETIRFTLKNNGALLHEFVIGTKQELDEHAVLMVKFPNMEHDEPYMAHVAPGQTGEIVWNFNRAGAFDFACLIAGHYQAGMVGRIEVSK